MASTESTARTQAHTGQSVTAHRSRWQPLLRSLSFNAVLLFGAFLSAFPFY